MIYLKVVAASVLAIMLWAALVVSTTLNGWWNYAIAPAANTRSFMDAAVEIIQKQNRGNVALVLISNGEVFAEYYAGIDDHIGRETIFSTASMSKWITANGVLHLTQEGKLDLDQPVSDYLTRWQLPPSEFDNNEITTRLLLSHMSGLTDGLGFGDYAPDETVPSLEQSLMNPRASDERVVEIKLGLEPGTQFEYSGGGYLILQLLVEELAGDKFEYYMQQALLKPLGMSRSTFGYIAGLDNRSNAYDADGQPAPLFRYAAAGATGFATSTGDMTKFVLAQLGAVDSSHPLGPDTLVSMRKPHARMFGIDIWGLGTILYAPADSEDFIFGHDGQNDPAINSAVRINPDNGGAIIVFVSGGEPLATKLGYEWVLWQTGRPDVLHIGAVIREALPILMIGVVLILLLAIVGTWRLRNRNLKLET